MNLDEIVSKWETTRLLSNCDSKERLAMCLESQLRLNQSLNSTPANFLRCSIPLVVRLFSETGRNAFANHFDKNTIGNAHFCKTKFKPPQDGGNLESEANYLAELALALKEEMDDIFKDKFKNEINFHGFACNESGDITLYWS